jgi:hypothetical protein
VSLARLAVVGTDRQLHQVRLDGSSTQLTLSLADNPLLMWGQPNLQKGAWSWPTWSPDGERLACFELPDGDDVSGPARVFVLEKDGVSQRNLLELSGRIPIYLSWRPDGHGLAVLMQEEEELVLGYVAVDQLGKLRIIEEGVPLFFTWGPDRRRILVHSATGQAGRVAIRDSEGRLPDQVLPQPPGNYCAPVVVGGRVVHVERRPGSNVLVSTNLDGDDVEELMEFEGLGAFVPAGEDHVVFAAAPKGEGNPYRGATLVHIVTGETTRLHEEDSLAFFWSEPGHQLLYARVDTDDNCLAWCSARPNESTVTLCQFVPSREMLFYLHFFDQFVLSHQLVSPDGRHLVFSGHLPGSVDGPASVFVKPLRTEEPPRSVISGSFACFSPQ